MSENNNNSTSTSSSVMTEVTNLIKTWEDEHSSPNYDPVPLLTRLAEICEVETDNYLKMDPDPFDERHPSRTDPDCKFGQILKALFRKDNFMNKLVNDYLRDTYYSRLGITGRDIDQLNIAACRLMLDVMPGLETSVVFQPDMDTLIHRLIKWTTNSIEPLQTYATGLLAAAMEISEIATRFREQNAKLVPLLLQRLRRLQNQSDFAIPNNGSNNNNTRPFAHLSIKSPPLSKIDGVIKTPTPPTSMRKSRENGIRSTTTTTQKDENSDISDSEYNQKRKRPRLDNDLITTTDTELSPQKQPQFLFSETSNSSWAELESFMIGTVQIFPPTLATRQILILRYLTPMGEYQEFLSHAFENDALSLILCYVNVRVTKEARLAFESLKYLAALLCHKKFAIEFLQMNGLEALLEVPRPSIAATGVSICLYNLGYCEDAMERVCLLPKYIITSLVKYGLWLLECSHDSGRCHAIMFFGLTFQFKVILEEFDAQDGLRKLHNVISTLSILLPDADSVPPLNEDQECAARQIVRHVCVAYRRYLEAHLNLKVEPIRRQQTQLLSSTSSSLSTIAHQQQQQQQHQLQYYKAYKSTSPEEIQEQVEILLQHMPFRAHWSPIDQLIKLSGITLLLKIIAFAYEWNYSGRAETVRSALDVLAIASVIPKVQLLFCERVDLPDESATVGMNIILGAAEGEIVADADVQKSALRVIVNCVCAPIHRYGGGGGNFNSPTLSARITSNLINSPNKKTTKVRNSEELIQKVWDCVRSNSGIMVLLQLMNVKTPITDADCIRTLACKALAGLARSETVRQIVSKLPLFTNGQLQNLMRDPILQEKRQEHVSFQKYALELLERLSGKQKTNGNDLEVSLANIHRANVVAQTKIQFNDRQLLQLIHQHLVMKNYPETAAMLVKEANLSHAIIQQTNSTNQPMKFRYSSTLTPTRPKIVNTPRALLSPTIPQLSTTTESVVNASPTIKIIKKNQNQQQTPVQNSKMQKQTNSDLPLMRITTNQPLLSSLSDDNNVEQPRITLDSIITEYLTNQHALCKNPMANCPQFNLFVPHKCPDPKPKITTANNVVVRCTRRALGYQCKSMNRKFIHSRFCPVQTIRSSAAADGGFSTCAKFLPDDRSIIVGDCSGEIRLFNLNNGNEELMFQAHDNYILHIEPNRTGEFLLSSSLWGRPLSALWHIRNQEMKFALDDEEYVEFSKVNQDRILGTKLETATIYDAQTGQSILRLVPTISNQYTKNKATFSPNDDLVLSDGVLFDVCSGKAIHKLDKLNQQQSGVFHPNGLEIVSNTEVWDIRTFHLLKTVPVLNQRSCIFSPVNNNIYAISMEQESDDGDSTFDTSFKTVDASDYTSIATIDVKRNIYDLAVNRYDTQIAIVENQGAYQSVQESVVRIYDVGRRRDDDDDEQDEDDDDDDDEDDDDDDDLDGSDDDDDDDDDNSDNGAFFIELRDDNADDNSNNDEDDDNDGNNDNDNDDDVDDESFNGNDSESWTSLSSGSEDLLEDDLF